jgi:putative ABC transport system permease protein
VDPQDAMKSAARGASAGGAGGRLRGWLVGAEVALSAVCLTIGGLLLHSLVKLTSVDVGFQAARVISIDLTLPDARYPATRQRVTFAREALRRLRAVPGVQAAGLVNKLPLSGEGGNNLVAPEGAAWSPLERPIADVRQVDEDYFRVMGIPLISGRLLAESDGDRKVVLVSASTAERLWPGKDPIGRRLLLGPDESDAREVTGVVGDVRSVGARKPATLTIYVPYWQRLRSELSLVSRTAIETDQVAAPMRAAIWQVDRDMSIAALRPMDDLVRASLAQDRFQTALVLLFGVAAALLASLGIYGVVSYSVAQRTNELGIRLALGAPPGRVRLLVLRQGLTPVAAGLALGLTLSVAAGRLVQALLFGVSVVDPLTMASVVLGLTTVAAAGTWLPARRATRVDPVTALREE